MSLRLLIIAAFLTSAFGISDASAASNDVEVPQFLSTNIIAASLPEALVATHATSAAEDTALISMLQAYKHRSKPEDYTALETFLANHVHSGWTSSVAVNLGSLYLHDGFYTKALAAFKEAWEEGKSAQGLKARVVVDGALGKLLWLEASVGQVDQLQSLFNESRGRAISGSATEDIQSASEILARAKAGGKHLFLCGPTALSTLMLRQGATHDDTRFVHTYVTGMKGVSLTELSKLADDHRFKHRLIFRVKGQAIPVPSIVHWKVGHFAAVVGKTGSRYEIVDPVFPSLETWVTSAALDEEASGYFLVPPTKNSDPGWRQVTNEEASKIWGKGPTNGTRAGDSNDPPANKPNSGSSSGSGGSSQGGPPPDSPNCGMCGYNIAESSVALTLSDTPVGYRPPLGPSTRSTISYNQREASQPQTFGFYNVSPKWTINWLTYVIDDPTTPGASVSRYLSGGGAIYYNGYTATGRFAAQDSDGSILVLASQSPVIYQRRLADGSVEVYQQSNGSTSYPRNIFLSKIVDAQGNALTLNYDSSQRLVSLTDAVGRQTTFTYGLSTRPLLITKVTDPFGRAATLAYDSAGRLKSITDTIALTSSFTYDANGLVSSLTTPYGTTTFAYTAPGTSSPPRYVQATDPLGFSEREEWLEPAPVPDSDVANTVPQGTSIPLINQYLEYRDSFHWDKNAYVAAGCTPTGGCDYTKARMTHFTHVAGTSDVKGTTVESIKYALENRIWFLYPGQSGSLYGGTYQTPTTQARVLDDGTTQSWQSSYDTAGYFKLTQTVDPLGRTTSYVYPNHIDLAAIMQTVDGDLLTIAQFIYNTQHRPLYYTDASGQTTSFIYNGLGQVTSVTDPLGHITKFAYDLNHNLSSITNANNATAATFTYDTYDRIASYTDSEGWTANFSYDGADRITQITYPDGTTDRYGYNRLDMISYSDRLKRTRTYSYDADRRLSLMTDPGGATTSFGYNHDDKLTSLTDAKGNVTSWTYDVEGRATSKVYADASTVTYAYESTTSRLKNVLDALGQIKRSAYALDDRVVGLAYQNTVNTTPSVTFTYDSNFPRVTSMVDGAGTTFDTYGSIGTLGALLLQQENGPLANSTISYGYDALGRLASRTVASAVPQTFQYDAIDRLTTEVNDLGTFAFSYLGETSQITSRALAGSNITTNWGYLTNANDRRLASIGNVGLSAATFSNYQLMTDSEAFIRELSESSDVVPAYPSATTQTASFNNLNQLTTQSGNALTYDANGNLLSDGQRAFSWDAENRLVGIAYPSQPGKATTFSYDGLGRRLKVTSTSGGGTTTSYLWCGSRLCQSRNATNVATRAYYAEGEYVFGTPPQRLFYGVDQIGSVRRVFAGVSNAPAYPYDSYGNALSSTNRLTDFGFAGMFTDPDSGLFLTLHRAYDPIVGRWLSRDPNGEFSRPERYALIQGALEDRSSVISIRDQYNAFSIGNFLYNVNIKSNSMISSALYLYANDNPNSLVDPDGGGCISKFIRLCGVIIGLCTPGDQVHDPNTPVGPDPPPITLSTTDPRPKRYIKPP